MNKFGYHITFEITSILFIWLTKLTYQLLCSLQAPPLTSLVYLMKVVKRRTIKISYRADLFDTPPYYRYKLKLKPS
jgi:hypothetical protein